MAAPETADELSHRVERQQRAAHLQRESNLEQSLAPFRVGSVGYLNAVPLTRGLEEEVIFATPSQLAEMLRRDELDAGLVSIVEVLFNDRYDILDGIAIASLGEVKSVILAHRKPLEDARQIFCDPASLTSIELARVLLAERGIKPEFKPLPNYDFANLPDYALLIGDRALDFSLAIEAGRAESGESNTEVAGKQAQHRIWDLGAAWFESTKLPFVYAAWALRRGLENSSLRRQLREARAFGLETLDTIIRTRTDYTYDFRKDYLSWHIHFHLGADEKRGLAKFIELLRKHGAPRIYEPKYVI
jgi:chorismate dehydratase